MTPPRTDGLAIHGGPSSVWVPLPRPWPFFDDEASQRVLELLDAGEVSDYDHGEVLSAFESTVRAYQGVRYALACASGTDALFAALFGLGVGPGDEVVVPTYSFHATVAPLFLLSAVPVLCDVDPLQGNIDVADAEARITERTRAIVYTHMWGTVADVDALQRVAAEHSLALVEDCSHAHGATVDERRVGNFSDAAIFSLGARKMVSGGMGGVLVTSREDVFAGALRLGHTHERAREMWPADDVAVGLGMNSRISLISAALCQQQYASLDDRIDVKRTVLEGLSARLTASSHLLEPPPPPPTGTTRGAWYGYKARFSGNPAQLDYYIAALNAEGVPVARPSNRPLHTLPMFESDRLLPAYYRSGVPWRTYASQELPGSLEYYARAVSFPAVHLHRPADNLLDQWASATSKVDSALASVLDSSDKQGKRSDDSPATPR